MTPTRDLPGSRWRQIYADTSPYARWGAAHFAELWYMFGRQRNEPWLWRDADRRLSDAMVRYWANFVRAGDPNGPGLPRWPTYDRQAPKVQVLRDPIKTAPVLRPEQLRTFDAVYGTLRKPPG